MEMLVESLVISMAPSPHLPTLTWSIQTPLTLFFTWMASSAPRHMIMLCTMTFWQPNLVARLISKRLCDLKGDTLLKQSYLTRIPWPVITTRFPRPSIVLSDSIFRKDRRWIVPDTSNTIHAGYRFAAASLAKTSRICVKFDSGLRYIVPVTPYSLTSMCLGPHCLGMSHEWSHQILHP